MSRRLLRQSGGQFRRATLERDFGLRVEVCSSCRGCNPYGLSEPRPEHCCQCGASLTCDQHPSHDDRLTLPADELEEIEEQEAETRQAETETEEGGW